MSRNLLILFMLFGTVVSSPAMDRSTADSLSVAAREAYAMGDHARALHLFDSVFTNYTSAGLLHNMANCYFKLNNIPQAILHYERALKLSPGDEDIQVNLELARQQIMDRVSEKPQFSLQRSLSLIFEGSDIDQWARRSIWASILTFILLAAAWLSTNNITRRILFALTILAFMGTLVSVSFAYLRHSALHDDSEAIILAPRTDVRSEPRAAGTTLFVLHKGTKVTILQHVDDWYEVSLSNGNVGWIQKGTLERI